MDYTWYWTNDKLNEDGSITSIRCAVPVLSSKKGWSVCGSRINIIESMQYTNVSMMTCCENCQGRIDNLS